MRHLGRIDFPFAFLGALNKNDQILDDFVQENDLTY